MRVTVLILFFSDKSTLFGEQLDDWNVGFEHVFTNKEIDSDFVGKFSFIIDR